MRQFARNELANQPVEYSENLYQFALDIPWTFTYHTQARARNVCLCGRCVNGCGAWVEHDIQEKIL